MFAVTALVIGFVFVAADALYAANFKPLPGADPLPAEVLNEISYAWTDADRSEPPRTKYLRNDGTPKYANRLLLEKAPYLRQHAHNPVNWFPWGDEAFDAARLRNLPVLLSIGYSSCHWCHVMEEESYDNESVARLINQNYIPIKVDRESNPEVDEIYILAVQLMGGNPGWPLHVFLTPERDPFLGMTYIPQDDFTFLLQRVSLVWNEDRGSIESTAVQVTQNLKSFIEVSSTSVDIGEEEIERVVAEMVEEDRARDEFDEPVARFPSESELILLLETALRSQHSDSLALAEKRLTEMAFGGIRDHVGGGFHRYTVDSEWLIPHFEKMLYNQAQLAMAYFSAYEINGKPLYLRVGHQILDYVLREMTDENGVFYSATDADSEGEEGVFFVWTLDEIREAVGEQSDFVIRHYGATDTGNFEGVNVLHVPKSPHEMASSLEMNIEDYLSKLESAVEDMRAYRDKREKPFLDRKIITAWNALMISSFAEAYRITDEFSYLSTATRAAHQIWNHHRDESGELYRIKMDEFLAQRGRLRDYAYYLQALVTLYDLTGHKLWLNRSEQLAAELLNQFWDIRRGGLYSTASAGSSDLIVRPKDRFDDALPSGNSVAAKALSQLYHRTGNEVYASRAKQIFQALGRDLKALPSAWPYALTAIQEYQTRSVGVTEHAAFGHAEVSFSYTSDIGSKANALVEIELDDGWHVQSNKPLLKNLIGTAVRNVNPDWTLTNVVYPPPEKLTVSFQSDPILVWSGTIPIQVNLEQTDQDAGEFGPVIEVRLQACDDKLCLLPETVKLEVPITAIKDSKTPSLRLSGYFGR